MQSIMETTLKVRPIYIDMSHLYVYEGPCRFGKGEELTYDFDRAMNEETNKRFLSEIEANRPDWVEIMDPVYVYRNDDWRIPDEMIDAMANEYQEVDFYLFADGARCGDVMLEFARRYPKPCISLSDIRGTTIINASLLSHGCEIFPSRDWDEIRRYMMAVRIRKMLKNLKVLLSYRFNANQSLPSAPDSFNDLNDVTDKFGTRFRFLNLHEMMDHLAVVDNDTNPTLPGRKGLNITQEEMKEIEEEAKELIAGAADNLMELKAVVNTLKMYRVIQKNMESEDCNAFTAPCPDACSTRRLNEEQCTMCLSHTLNNERGIPSACEYDITALLCMTILGGVSGKAPYMSNSIEVRLTEEGIDPAFPFISKETFSKVASLDNLMATYHAVPNRKMHGFDSEESSYGLQPFAYSGWAATLRYDFDQDKGEKITQIRIDPNCKKMMITRGTVAGGFGYDQANCTEGLFFTVEDRERYFHTQRHFGLHMPLVFGDYVKEMTAVAEVLGLETEICL